MARNIVGLAIVLMGLSAQAAEPTPSGPSLPPPPPPPSSLETLASQFVKGLYGGGAPAAVPGQAFTVAIRFDKPPDGTRPDALVSHLADALEAAVRAHHAAGPRVAAEDAIERIEVELQVQLGHLAATARRRLLPRHIWSALMAPDGQVLGTGFSSVPMDLEVRTLLGLGRRDVKLGELRVVPVGKKSLGPLGGEPALDLVIGDFDGDGGPELAVLQPDAVRFVRWSKGGFSEDVGVFSLRAAAVSRARLRSPIGRLVPVVRADGRTVLVAASSERAEALAIGWGPAGPERLNVLFQKGWPLYATGVDRFLVAPWPEASDVIEGTVTEARFGTAGAQLIGALPPLYDVRAYAHRDLRGAFQPVIVSARPSGDLLAGAAGRLPEQGTAFVWSDVDADGELEALLTSTALTGPDRLSLARGGALAQPPRWVGQAAAPVTAATAGDVDRDGFLEIVIATWSGRAADLVLVVPK